MIIHDRKQRFYIDKKTPFNLLIKGCFLKSAYLTGYITIFLGYKLHLDRPLRR